VPLTIPTLDDRKYQQILDEALARVPVHNPEWTNFNKSDPGVTLIEVFSFLAESLLFRANQIPERNRRKFLQLLGLGLLPGASARGLVSFSYSGALPTTVTLNADVELRAGQIPFRTEAALDVLPIEAQAFYKKRVVADPDTVAYYNQLYAALREGSPPATLELYQTTAFSPRGTAKVNLGQETTDQSLWLALLLRPSDKPYAAQLDRTREALLGKTLSLGIVPAPESVGRELRPGGPARAGALAVLNFQIPSLPPLGKLPENTDERSASYRTLKTTEVPASPSVVELTLPASVDELKLWSNLDPLEAGAGDFPPSLDGMEQNERLITWLRIVPSAPAQTTLLWTGINTVFVRQRVHVQNELLPDGNGEPDQTATLSRRPVLPGSLTLRVSNERWSEIDDLTSAGPEVPVPDLRAPPGTPADGNPRVKVFAVDPEAAQIRFGDGLHGARPPRGATLRADYDYGVGRAGNVGPLAITTGPGLPASIKVTNPLATWGGADPETVNAAEKQIPRFLQHRERLVNARDFETLTLRTPGVAVGRVDVLSAYHPALSPNQPGNAPGAVTVMVLPKHAETSSTDGGPDAFLDAVACWLDPRRLVTTEVFVRRPDFRRIWVSIGLDLVAGVAIAAVREAVVEAVERFLSPLAKDEESAQDAPASLVALSEAPRESKGWPLSKPVVALELVAVASRVAGVAFVTQVLLADEDGKQYDQIPMVGLDLPLLAGLSVAVGPATPISDLRGTTAAAGATSGQPRRPATVPVPVIPEEC
jgi:hypothetical protein